MKTPVALLETTFIENHSTLLQLLKRYIGCSDTAEELVQEAYLRVMQLDTLNEITNLPGYLFRVATNLAKDHARRISLTEQNDISVLDDQLACMQPTPDTVMQAQQELDRLEQLISELPPQCQRIFLLCKLQHLSHAEIAELLNISPRTVEKQIGKALKILRDRMLY
jgi:RNA polymerase sigma-70 factor (ECF subfamily)